MISLEVKDLTKRFGRKIVLNRLNFSQNSGILGISGPNGSGKSTLLKLLANLYTSPKGSIVWKKDETVLQSAQFKQKLGFAAPYVNLYSELSAFENIQFLNTLRRIDISRNELQSLASALGVTFSLEQAYGSLSSGQQQRVKLLGALIGSPEIILLDEPGSNLDEDGIDRLLSIIQQRTNQNTLIVIASNSAKELSVCSKVISVVE
jgi:ABC-type multidrug transport system ATPase subunit